MKHSHHLVLQIFSFVFVISLLLNRPSDVLAQESVPLKPNPIAEQWVLEQTARGKIADLEIQFPNNEEERVLSAAFLEALLENPSIDITRYGVRIRNAIFVEPLSLEFIQVEYNLQLENCQFEQYVDLSDSRFAGDLSLRDSTFKARADFSNIHIDKTFRINAANFEASTYFIYATIGGNLVADDSNFTDIEEEADFNSLAVEKSVFLRRAIFAGPVDFIHANIGVNINADEVQFTNAEKEVNFNSMKVGSSVRLNKAVFAGPVDFGSAQIGVDFSADDTQFTNAEEEGTFNSMKVGRSILLRRAVFAGSVDFNSLAVEQSVFLQGAVFAGPVDFGSAQIGVNFSADDTQFTNAEEEGTFNSMKVGRSIFLRRAIFAGPVDFIHANIGVNIAADEVQFTNAEKEVNFNSMKVGNSVHLNKAIFAGFVDFTYSQTGNVFDADEIQFGNKEKEARFRFINVAGNILLRRAIFAGPVDFGFAHIGGNLSAADANFKSTEFVPNFGNVIIDGEARFEKTVFRNGADFDDATFLDLLLIGDDEDGEILEISLNRTVVKRELLLDTVRVQNLYAKSLTVYGPTIIKNMDILNSADFENSIFSNLSIENVEWTDTMEGINIGGMQYQNIKIVRGTDEDAWNELIVFLDLSKYNAQAYTTLGNYFLEQGYPERADKIYIAYKRRERAEALSLNSLDWWWSLFLDVFVSYGRSPGRALIWSSLLILFGSFVFRKKDGMVSLSKREVVSPKMGKHGTLSRKIPMRVISSPNEIPYHPFWYSLDLFIPFVDLGFDKEWSPKPYRKWAVAYSKLHMLAGWILIPIGLLAVTGVIK